MFGNKETLTHTHIHTHLRTYTDIVQWNRVVRREGKERKEQDRERDKTVKCNQKISQQKTFFNNFKSIHQIITEKEVYFHTNISTDYAPSIIPTQIVSFPSVKSFEERKLLSDKFIENFATISYSERNIYKHTLQK